MAKVVYCGMEIEELNLEDDPDYQQLKRVAQGFAIAFERMKHYPKATCEE